MKTVTIPFDLEMAKKIQSGEVKGKIVDKIGIEYEIVKYDAKGNYPMIGVYFDKQLDTSHARSFTTQGIYDMEKESNRSLQLVLPWYLTYEEGQYVTIETKEYTHVLIYKYYLEVTTNPVYYHVFFNTTDKDLRFNSYCDDGVGVEVIRPSTPSEIELMHELLLKNGKRWNPETKRVEDVKKEPEPEFKPFDRVLGRDYESGTWKADFFSHMTSNSEFRCISDIWNCCIPYDGNEHLVGTTDNPKEHED